MPRIKKNKKEAKNPSSSESESEARKEEKMDHQGKIDQVPWSAVQAYLAKYKGIGRLMDRFNKSADIAKSKIVATSGSGVDKLAQNNYKLNNMDSMYGGLISRKGLGYLDKNGNFHPNKILSQAHKEMQQQQQKSPVNQHKGPYRSPSPEKSKRTGGNFMPLSEDSDTDNSDTDYEPEELDHDSHLDYDGYATSMHNMLLKSYKPSSEHIDHISKMGKRKDDMLGVELELAKRAKDVLVNEQALQLFSSRLEMMVQAQKEDSTAIVELQPGAASECVPNSFKLLLTECSDQYMFDCSAHDQVFTNALTNSHRFTGFLTAVCECLERNENFEFEFAHYFTTVFCDYISSLINSYNSDFVCKVVAKCHSIFTRLEAVHQFLNALLYFVTQKKLVIERQVDFQANEGIVLTYSDVELNKTLNVVNEMNQVLDKLILVLSNHKERVQTSLKGGKSLQEHSHNLIMNIRKRIDRVKLYREKLSQQPQGEIKEGSGMGQVLDDKPTEDEKTSLSFYSNIRQIGNDDHVLQVIRQLILSKIERTKVLLGNVPFVNLVPLEDLEECLRITGNAVVMNQPETLDGQDNFNGVEIWHAEASNLINGTYNFDSMKKVLLCQGYIQAARLNQERCRQLLHNIAMRIGTDPLAPRIITKNMAEILQLLGYYIEENVGIQQALDQLSRNIRFTQEMDDDLGKCIEVIKAGTNGLSTTSFVDNLLDSILKSFGAPIRAQDFSETEKLALSSLVCGACNRIYSMEKDSIPLTLPCGDLQCLACSCSLKKCFICNLDLPNLPTTPSAYNPTVNYPINFIAGMKANAANMTDYIISYCSKTSNYSGAFSQDQLSCLAFLSQLNSELYMCNHTSNKPMEEKIDSFFKDIISCSSPPQLMKIVVQMLDKQSVDFCKDLVERALTMVDVMGESKTVKYITLNTLQAIVTASRLPAQPLLVEALISGTMEAMQKYCSPNNISAALDIFKSRRVFFNATHMFQYNECIPMALECLTQICKTMESESFDSIMPASMRAMMLKETQETIIMVQEAAKSENLSGATHYMREYFDMFYDTTFIYLYPTGLANDDAKIKISTLLNTINNDLIENMTKKYPSTQSMEIDPTLVNIKYVEVMMHRQKELLHQVFDFGITSAKEALAKEAEFNNAVQTNSEIELGRQKLQWPGIKIDIPTDSSVLKNLPPYICAVNGGPVGACQATPLYNYMMSDGSWLDNPYRVTLSNKMELCHTEGSLFYSGIDGFLEEYDPLTLDPKVVDSQGRIKPEDNFFAVRSILETASYITNTANTPSNIINNDMVARMSEEMQRIARINRENRNYFVNLSQKFFRNPLVNLASLKIFGVGGPAVLNVLSGVADYFKSPDPDMHNLGNLFSTNNFNYFGSGIHKGSHVNLHNSEQVQNYSNSRLGHLHRILKDQHILINNKMHGGTLLKPILDHLKMKVMRKRMHDINDEMTHKLGLREQVEMQQVPKCGHCESTKQLHVMTKGEPEVVCNGCKEGMGITASRKIMSNNNSEMLAFHDPKSPHSTEKIRQMSDMYNKYIRSKEPKKVHDSSKSNENLQPVNYQWRKFRHSALAHFRHDPDQIIHNFSQHKMTEPLNYTHSHLNKNTALLAGKMHSMMHLEKKHMPPHEYENLRHNYHWHVAHLPNKGGKSFRPYQIHDFEEMARGIDTNPNQLKFSSDQSIANNYI